MEFNPSVGLKILPFFGDITLLFGMDASKAKRDASGSVICERPTKCQLIYIWPYQPFFKQLNYNVIITILIKHDWKTKIQDFLTRIHYESYLSDQTH